MPFRGPPRYNPKRRSAAWGGWWTAGDRSSLASSTRIPAEFDALLRRQGPAASPCSLERPFSSASSSISDASHPSHEDDASILTGKADCSCFVLRSRGGATKDYERNIGSISMSMYKDAGVCSAIQTVIHRCLQYFSLAKKKRYLLNVIENHCTKIGPRDYHRCQSEH